ncbi:uncharacterized protein LOC100166545 [Acyrthosiphon pisum]|uniref:Secreted protein n=1 Tax=Acyrthosiphon pisum TaxID=7029 RepID=A0A8R1W5I8_ACYPI|nr:uncharacterized protein LOC100166545 [Acyrthosiphon pisum]|eukprot:XP_001951405.1 PREDICTED: uncharacterized protein LOC100166545 [Acyrthosiphon pisum]
MKSYSAIAVSIVLAIFAANTSAQLDSFFGQDTCDIKYQLHENLASVLTNSAGVELLNELRQNIKDICLDPKAHNAIVALLDGVMDVTTDTNVSQSLGNIFYWARKVMKDPNFRIVWHENMKGVNMCFDNIEVTRQITDTIMDNLVLLLNHPKFDSTFESVIKNLSKVINFRKNIMYKAAGALFSKPAGPTPRPSFRNRPSFK